MVINALRNSVGGPGGGARHLHGDDIGFDSRIKVKRLPEVIFRKKIKKRSAEQKAQGNQGERLERLAGLTLPFKVNTAAHYVRACGG